MRILLASAACLLALSCGETPPSELPLASPKNPSFSPLPTLPGASQSAGSSGLPNPQLAPLAADKRAPCDIAATERTKAAELLGKGRAYRALRLIARADTKCPAGASTSWSVRLKALDQIGRNDEAIALAKEILASPSADPAAVNAARAVSQKTPNSPAAADTLVAAAVAASARGDADARLQFDRALVQIERETNTKPAVWLDTRTPRRPLALSRDGSLALLGHGTTASLASARDLFATHLFDHASPVTAGAFSSDGKRLATADAEAVVVWDTAAGKHLFRLVWSGEKPQAVTFAPDGKRLLVAGGHHFDATLRVWNAETGDSVEAFTIANAGTGSSAAVSRDGKLAAVGTDRGVIELWSLGPPKRVAELAKKDSFLEEVSGLTFSPKGDRVAAVFENGTVSIWETAKGKQLHTSPGERGFDEPKAIAFTADGARLVASGRTGFQGVVREWDMTSFAVVQNRPMPAHAAAFSEDLRAALCTDGDAVSLVDPTSGSVIVATPPKLPRVEHIVFGPPRTLLVALNDENALRVFSPEGARYFTASGDYGPVAVSLDGRLVARSLYRSVALWDVPSGRLIQTFPELAESPDSLAFGWSGDHLRASSERFDELAVFFSNVARPSWSRPFYQKIAGGARSFQLSRFGRYAAFEDRKRVTVLDLWNGVTRELEDGGKGSIDGTELSPDGRTLFVSRGRELSRFTTETLARIGSSAALPCSSWGMTSSFDGSRLLVDCASSSTTKIVFSDTEGAAISSINLGQERERTLDIAPHGDLIAAGYEGGRVKLIRFSDGALMGTLTAWPRGEAALVEAPDGRAAVFGKDTAELTKWMRCRLGSRAYPFEVCADAVLDLDLLAELFAP